MRCFISIDIPEKVREEIKRIQNNLPEFFGKKTESENLHLTLKFLGEIDEEKMEKVKEKLKSVSFNKLETEIDSIGVFSEKFVRIVWLHLSGMEELQKQVDEKLDKLFQPEQRFMSHLTIARVKSVRDRDKFLQELSKIKIENINFVVDKFRLKKSILTPEGPVYEILEEYKLD